MSDDMIFDCFTCDAVDKISEQETEITRLRADLAAERDRNGIITQAAQEVTNALRAELAAVTAERDRMREALKRIDGMATKICMLADAGYGMSVENVMPIYETARAALEGVTKKEGAGNE